MSETRGLGRGLSALIGERAAATPGSASGSASGDGLRKLPVGRLMPGRFQPRTQFNDNELNHLAESLRHSGMMQPIVARPAPDDANMFEIVAGERRWRAAQKAQLHEVPVIIRSLSDQEVLEMGLVENLQRQDLGPLEESAGYERLRKEFELTQMEIGNLVGKSRAHIANTPRLLQLPASVCTLLDIGKLSAGHGRALLGARDPEALAQQVLDRTLSVRDTEALVQAEQRTGGSGKGARAKPKASPISADQRELQNRLTTSVGLKVEIQPKGESGRLVLNYASLEQLEDVIARLEGPPRPRLVRN